MDDLLTVREVCEALHCARSTLYTMRYFRQRFVRVGKRGVRVRKGDLALYLHLYGQAA